MRKIILNAALVAVFAGCASAPEGAPPSAPAPAAETPVADAAPVVEAPVVEAPVVEATVVEAPVGNEFYTRQQANRGETLFQDYCSGCHSASEFTGSTFRRRWTNQVVGAFYVAVFYTMPEDNPGGLPEQTIADIIAFMLSENDFPAGDSELPTSIDLMMLMPMYADAGSN